MPLKQYKILELDPWLKPYAGDIDLRMQLYREAGARLLGEGQSLSDFASGHLYFGFHRTPEGWYYREWAPGAEEISLLCDLHGWDPDRWKMTRISAPEQGIWEIFLPGADALPHGCRVRIRIKRKGKFHTRIPLYCKRVVQDPEDLHFYGQVWDPPKPFRWSDGSFRRNKEEPLLIYECHVGMSGEEEKVTSFREFTGFILPRVKMLGYNAIQLMAVMEHPYYGSFGYQVSNFFAVSSRFGTPEDFKELVDTAHSMGIAVLLDLVHSHAARNSVEGIAEFDGTDYQFFHAGARGDHPAWGTRLFHYGKPEVIHFLLSNIKYWQEEYHLDGFRFDGVTSMLYHDHGLGGTFDTYARHFSLNTDVEAVTYLQLAAKLSKELNPDSVLIAEDMSGMPGMCLPVEWGGVGFDYRLGMGVPDLWIGYLRDRRDEDWHMGHLWHELNQRRPGEKVIGYCESHDQAMVGDKTIMFRLADCEMYWNMDNEAQSIIVSRAVALHKLIRLITCTCAGEGYLTFMGNEFGHPEWIDFPREGNDWSHKHARRQWSLADNGFLRYQGLQHFDQAMIRLVRENRLTEIAPTLLVLLEDRKLICYEKGEFLFLFNFHPSKPADLELHLSKGGTYELVLHSRWEEFSGHLERTPLQLHVARKSGKLLLNTTVEPRSAMVLHRRAAAERKKKA